MTRPWIKIDDLRVSLDHIPSLLDRYNLLPDFLRRLLETKYTHKIIPNKDDQIKYFNTFLKNNNMYRAEGNYAAQFGQNFIFVRKWWKYTLDNLGVV